MTEVHASRTLVKSPPELWAECSDPAALGRHLGGFGEIRITRLDPETAVAWEGERVRGTVRIEPAGWGTKVVLTAEQLIEEPAPPEPVEAAVEPTPEVAVEVAGDVPVEPTPEVAVEVAGDVPVEVVSEAAVEVARDAEPVAEPPPHRRRWRLFARLRRPERVAVPPAEPRSSEPPAEPELIEPPAEPELIEPPPEPGPEVVERRLVTPGEAALAAALDSLGQAHHRPFSRG